MSQFINKILGRDDEKETHNSSTIRTSTGNSSASTDKNIHSQTSSGQATEGRTVQHEGVNIKSTISSDAVSTVSMANQQKLNNLVSRLGSTHNQIDEYAKKQSAKINEEIEREIDEVLARTRREQEELLRRANERTIQLDIEYRARLQTMIEEVDADKAQRITEIEKELNAQQTGILESARNEIDRLNQKAANLKIGAIQQAQERATTQVNEITAQAAQLGQTSTTHHGKGTTTIKTEITGETTTKDTSAPTITAMASGTKATSETKTVETSRNQSQAIKK